uniref:Uncharacterized protein n=1 Tax=Plectus sambesii TaxID=2011161 RepID=A0A914X3Y8_9BILA
MGKLGKGITNILRDYSGWTGTHGVPHIGMAQNMCLRVFWSIVFVFSFGMFIWQMSVLFKKYYSYEVNVETELKFSERVFPAVTTCHLNPWKASEVEGTPIEVLIEKYKNALTGVSDSELTEWGFQGLSNPEIQKRAMRWSTILGAELNLGATPFIVDNITVGYNYSAAYNYSDLVMNCAYNTEGCNISYVLV